MHSRTVFSVAILSATVLASACATKRYPIATPLAPAEVSLLSCKDIALELVRADQVELQIDETGKMDGKTALGFLGDFGVGNGMAKAEARKALNIRRAALHDAQLQKGCMKDVVPAT